MFAAFIVSFLATVIATPICLVFIKKFGLFDDPKKRSHPATLHKKPVPRGGGIPLFLGAFLSALFVLPLTNLTLAIFAASFVALVIGVLDDKYDVSPYVRFLFNLVAAAIVVGSGISIPFITNPFGGILHLDTLRVTLPLLGQGIVMLASDLVALVWIVWVMNILNWSKGVDGQMPGVVAISAVVIGALSLRFQGSEEALLSATLSFIIAGASLGFLLFNFHPAKIFPGYGATSLYLLLAVVSILAGAKLATAILVMGVPMVDGVFTILRRTLSGRSPFWHDNRHLHHLLLQRGFSQAHIALFYWAISAILGSLSFVLSSKGKLFALIMVGVVVGGALLFLHIAFRNSNGKHGT